MNKYGFYLFLISITSLGQKCLETKHAFYKNGILNLQIIQSYDGKRKLIKKTENHLGNDDAYVGEFVYEYDNKDNNTRTIYSQNGKFRNVVLKQYSANGTLISEDYSTNENAIPSQKTTFINNVSEKTFKGEKSKERKEFDKDGKLIKSEYLDENSIVKRSLKNDYDAQGKILKSTQFDAREKLTIETVYEYDSKGKVLIEKALRNGELYNQTAFEYNSAEKLIKKIRRNATNQVEYFYTYEYDASNQQNKEIYWYNNKVVNYMVMKYDIKGNKIKEEYYNPSNAIVSYREWEYECK